MMSTTSLTEAIAKLDGTLGALVDSLGQECVCLKKWDTTTLEAVQATRPAALDAVRAATSEVLAAAQCDASRSTNATSASDLLAKILEHAGAASPEADSHCTNIRRQLTELERLQAENRGMILMGQQIIEQTIRRLLGESSAIADAELYSRSGMVRTSNSHLLGIA